MKEHNDEFEPQSGVLIDNNAPPLPRISTSYVPINQIIIQGIKPKVTYFLCAITIIVYLLQVGSEINFGWDIPAALGMKVNNLIHQGQVWRLITPMFLHGSILHLGLNMYALVILGQALEPSYGYFRFLCLYFIAGFFGNVFSTLFSTYPSLGSSTAIFGLIAAQGVFIYQNRKFFGSRAKQALTNIAVVALINFIIGLSPGIDNWGHLGGFLGGIVFAWFVGPLLQGDIQPTHNGFALILNDKRSNHQQWISAIIVCFILIAFAYYFVFIYK